MKYRLSQLVNVPSQAETSGPQSSTSNSLTHEACIDLDKSIVSISNGLPPRKRLRRKSNAPRTKIVPFYRGQPIELQLEIHLKRPLAEGSSLVLFSPFLTGDGDGAERAPARRRLWRIIRNLTQWRSRSHRVFSLREAMVRPDAQDVDLGPMDLESDTGSAAKPAEPVSKTEGVKRAVSAPTLFRFWPIDDKSGLEKVMPLIIETAMLNPANPAEPVLRLSLKEKEKSVSRLGVRLPAEYWQNMIFLFCKPSYVAFSLDAHDKAAEIIETITIHRSDGGPVKMSAAVEKQHRAYMELEFIAANMCRIRLVARAAREALKTSGKPRLIINLSFTDEFSNRILKCHIPVKIALATCDETAAPAA